MFDADRRFRIVHAIRDTVNRNGGAAYPVKFRDKALLGIPDRLAEFNEEDFPDLSDSKQLLNLSSRITMFLGYMKAQNFDEAWEILKVMAAILADRNNSLDKFSA